MPLSYLSHSCALCADTNQLLCGHRQVVRQWLPKPSCAGSNPVARSIIAIKEKRCMRVYARSSAFFTARFTRVARSWHLGLQNFFTHIRKLPHFDTRFSVAKVRCGSPQKRAFSKCPGRSVVACLTTSQFCSRGQFLGSKRVLKWGIFLISLNFFVKQILALCLTCNLDFSSYIVFPGR